MKTVVVSGYFDPLHIGHLELIQRAKELADRLVVIINNDKQAMLKKGMPFMPADERKKIIESIRWVDKVFISIDKDKTVCESLEQVHNFFGVNIFANGGDRKNLNDIPEYNICNNLGIKMVDGLGEKIQASSELIKKFNQNNE